MSRIREVLQRRDKSFIAYLCAGDGGVDYTVAACLALVEGGVDVVELGVPFSDPVADGPVIQAAAQRALERETTPDQVLEIARRIRTQTQVPLLLFSYYNPLFACGQSFYQRAAAAGIDGILVVDLPPEESTDHLACLRESGLGSVFLVSPSTPDSRLPHIATASSEFVYYACRKGTTGMRNELPAEFVADIARIRRHIELPIAVGFGIADRESASRVLDSGVQGFVVGSAFVDAVAHGKPPVELREIARRIDPRRHLKGDTP